MSCIASIGSQHRTDIGTVLPRTLPEWSEGKQDRLYRQATSTDPRVRAVAANHPRLPQGWMFQLLQDDEVSVRRAAVKNPALPRQLLLYATSDSDPGVRAYARLCREE